MGISQLGGFLDVFDQVCPGRGKPFIRLRFRATLDKSFYNSCRRDLFAAAVEDFCLELSNRRISFIAEIDSDLRHHAMHPQSHL